MNLYQFVDKWENNVHESLHTFRSKQFTLGELTAAPIRVSLITEGYRSTANFKSPVTT